MQSQVVLADPRGRNERAPASARNRVRPSAVRPSRSFHVTVRPTGRALHRYHLFSGEMIFTSKKTLSQSARSFLLCKMVNWGMSAKTCGTFRRKTKTAASRPDDWPGDERRNCVVREQHDFAARTQNVVHGRPVNQSIYLFICVSIYLPTAGLDPPVETHEKSICQ